MKRHDATEVLVIGSGYAGIATAYYLSAEYGKSSIMLVDPRAPMSFTSAQSGDNYRNWWPHSTMVAFTDDSITKMERLAVDTDNAFHMTRRGYALATRRKDIDELVEDLRTGYRLTNQQIRIHDSMSGGTYSPVTSRGWQDAPDGVDVLSTQSMIRRYFPTFSEDIRHVIHIRRAGDIRGQQLGQFMLDRIRNAGGTLRSAAVSSIQTGGGFIVTLSDTNGVSTIHADVIVNAAGPFAREVAGLIGVDVPMTNIYQQKIAFEDTKAAIPRNLAFAIDLDAAEMGWTEEERSFLEQDLETAWLAKPLPGGAHCRPDGGEQGRWVKLGWAFNRASSNPQQDLANEPRKHPMFPELVIRATSKLNPSLGAYLDEFPTRFSHYGGYYPMTAENWPLVGPLGVDGAFITGALSGYGCMAACAAGRTCAAWIAGGVLPDYAEQISPRRYRDKALMAEIAALKTTGIL